MANLWQLECKKTYHHTERWKLSVYTHLHQLDPLMHWLQRSLLEVIGYWLTSNELGLFATNGIEVPCLQPVQNIRSVPVHMEDTTLEEKVRNLV